MSLKNKSHALFGVDRRIGRLLVVLIVAFSSIMMLVISSIQLAIDYFQLRSGLEKQLDVVSVYVPSVAESVWNFDQKQIRLNLAAMKQLPNVDQVRITSDRESWVIGEAISSNTVRRVYPLIAKQWSKDHQVGKLEVIASVDGIYRQVAASALVIVLGNGAKTFLVSFFMLFLFRRLVTNRLEILARKVEDLRPPTRETRALGSTPTAQESAKQGDELDELGRILDETSSYLKEATREREEGLRRVHETERAHADAEHQRQLAVANAERADTLLRANATLESLGAIGREITCNLESATIFAALRQHVHALLDASTFVIHRLEADGTTLSMVFGVEAGQPLVPQAMSIDDPTRNTARCARERRELVVNLDPGHTHPLAGSLHTLSLLYAPLMVGERLLGVMTIQSLQAQAYGDREIAIFHALCAYGAIALANGEAQAQLIQSEKLASLGQLVASVAHEINTPIAAVKSSGKSIADALEQLQESTPLFGTLDLPTRHLFARLVGHVKTRTAVLSSREERAIVRDVTQQLEQAGIADARHQASLIVQLNAQTAWADYLPLLRHPQAELILNRAHSSATIINSTANINTAVERVSKIIFALKSLSRVDSSGHMVEVPLRDGMESVLTIYQSQIKQGITLVQNYQDIPPLRCLPDELNQVWTNLIHNALQAMRHQGTLTIGIGQENSDAVVSVADTGCGIPDAIRSRIFDPFFTTKPVGEGSGLGLDIAKKIVDKHCGRIEVRSEVGVGTAFRVILPLQPSMVE